MQAVAGLEGVLSRHVVRACTDDVPAVAADVDPWEHVLPVPDVPAGMPEVVVPPAAPRPHHGGRGQRPMLSKKLLERHVAVVARVDVHHDDAGLDPGTDADVRVGLAREVPLHLLTVRGPGLEPVGRHRVLAAVGAALRVTTGARAVLLDEVEREHLHAVCGVEQGPGEHQVGDSLLDYAVRAVHVVGSLPQPSGPWSGTGGCGASAYFAGATSWALSQRAISSASKRTRRRPSRTCGIFFSATRW